MSDARVVASFEFPNTDGIMMRFVCTETGRLSFFLGAAKQEDDAEILEIEDGKISVQGLCTRSTVTPAAQAPQAGMTVAAIRSSLASCRPRHALRYKVLLRPDGLTLPLLIGTNRRLVPEENNAPGWEWDSRPFLRLRVGTGSDNVKEAPDGHEYLFLIDSGANSASQWSPSLKKSLGIEGPENESQCITLFLENEAGQKPWRLSMEGKTRVQNGVPSPHEHSVLGVPWMNIVRPLFVFEEPAESIERRVVVKIPSSGRKAAVRVKMGRRGAEAAHHEDVCMVVDTGCAFTTFPEACVERLGLERAMSASFPEGSKKTMRWFDSVPRNLFWVTFADAQTNGEIWTLTNPLGSTAREYDWGLLGVDWLLKVRPLIIYEGYEDEHAGEYLEEMVMEAVDIKDLTTKPVAQQRQLELGERVLVTGNTSSKRKCGQLELWDEGRASWLVRLDEGKGVYLRPDQVSALAA